MHTKGKIEIPAGARKEAELLFMHEIAALVEKQNIPPNLIMNLDQTPSKYVPSGRHSSAQKTNQCLLRVQSINVVS